MAARPSRGPTSSASAGDNLTAGSVTINAQLIGAERP